MKRKKDEKNFWQKLRAFIIRPRFTRYFFARVFAKGKKIKIELDKRDIKRIGQAVSQELAKVIAKPVLDKEMISQLARELKKEIIKKLPGVVPMASQGKVSQTKAAVKLRRIKIKESFIDPTEEAVKLKSSFSRELKKKRTSGAGLEKSLKALKKISD